MNIFRTILSEVTGTDYAKTEAGSIEQLVRKITDFLEGKRYTFCTMSTSLIVDYADYAERWVLKS
jgi:hypothetical protein